MMMQTRLPIESQIDRGATFSPCRLYRYTLWRVWSFRNDHGLLGVIGLNPSTADETKDDPTIRRCISYAKGFGYGGLLMLNAYAFRATHPKDMLEQDDPVGPENNATIEAAVYRTNTFICCWGANIDSDRELAVYEIIKRCNVRCLGVTKDGHPAHPLYLRSDTPLRVWSPRE